MVLLGNKKAKQQKEDLMFVTSIELTKVESLQTLSTSIDRLVASIENKQRHDTWMKLALFYKDMGDHEEAMKYAKIIKEDQERINKEQEAAAKVKEAGARNKV